MAMTTLDRILQSQGFGSRKACRMLVEAGLVSVDGRTVTDEKAAFPTEGLTLAVDGETVPYREFLYIALNKPAGIECSARPSHHRSVLELLDDRCRNRGVQPVGRLDHDTTGLLLLSDDGTFIHRQSSPKHHVPKLYRATTARPVTAELVAAMLAGVQLHDEDGPLRALRCERAGEFGLDIVLEQGKYHQVKRMLAAAGNHCAALRRTAIGGLELDSLGLEEGRWLFLDQTRLALLAPAD